MLISKKIFKYTISVMTVVCCFVVQFVHASKSDFAKCLAGCKHGVEDAISTICVERCEKQYGSHKKKNSKIEEARGVKNVGQPHEGHKNIPAAQGSKSSVSEE